MAAKKTAASSWWWSSKGGPRLGFIIEDVAPSASVDAERGMVDLYGYTSMAVATLQHQARELEALRLELSQLRAELEALRGQRRAGTEARAKPCR